MKKTAQRAIEADEGFVKGYYSLAVAQLRLEEFADTRLTIERGLALSQQGNTQDFDLLQLQLNDLVALVACAKCGKAYASSVCSRCHVTSYCSRECQVAYWKEHKKSCETRTSGDTLLTIWCENCSKSPKSLRLCSRCKNAHYCSRACQLEHWKLHKPKCERTVQCRNTAASRGLTAQHELFKAWRDQAKVYLSYLATLGMTKKQFLEQPPSFVATIKVKFNYNSMTYLPCSEPSTLPITVLPDADIRKAVQSNLTSMAKVAESSGKSFLTHVLLIEDITLTIMSVNLGARTFHQYSREDIERMIQSECNLNPTLKTSWLPLSGQNFQSQVDSFIESAGSNWLSFVLYTLRVYSTQPRYNTHAIVIDVELGFGLGQIGKILGYKVIKLQDARDLYRQVTTLPPAELDDVLRNQLDVENSPRLLNYRVSHPRGVMLPVIFRVNMLLVFTVPLDYELEDGMALLPPKQCDEKANECFRRLQNVSLPDVSSPDLANVRAVIH